MITIEQLKAFAHQAEEEISEAAHKFVAFVERELGLGNDGTAVAAPAIDTAQPAAETVPADTAAAPAADAPAA